MKCEVQHGKSSNHFRASIVGRITREIEEAVTSDYPGEGLISSFGFGRMFVELPKAKQWEALNAKVDWTGLTREEKDQVMDRVLEDVQEKAPEEIYPGTWFDGIQLSIDPSAKMLDLKDVRKQLDAPGRDKSLDERVCEPERIGQKQRDGGIEM
jgi:hypothetical protein